MFSLAVTRDGPGGDFVFFVPAQFLNVGQSECTAINPRVRVLKLRSPVSCLGLTFFFFDVIEDVFLLASGLLRGGHE